MVKLAMNDDDCCASDVRKNDIINKKTVPKSGLLDFSKHAKALYTRLVVVVVAAATTILLYISFLKSEAMCCY
jgi:cell division protein FtsL